MSRDDGNIIYWIGYDVPLCNSDLQMADFNQSNNQKIHSHVEWALYLD